MKGMLDLQAANSGTAYKETSPECLTYSYIYTKRLKPSSCSALSASTPKLVSIVGNTWVVNYIIAKRWCKSPTGGLMFVSIVEYDILKPWFICLKSLLLFIFSTKNRKIKHQITHYTSLLTSRRCTSVKSELVLFDYSLGSVSHEFSVLNWVDDSSEFEWITIG